ncbi:MAG: RNA polymerase sigma factor, partial [Chitinophagaceae bacterium]
MATFTLYNEKELLTLASQGDEGAFTRLFYAYHNKLGAYVLQLTRSRETAEEVVQDVFIKIWTNRESLAGVEHFGPYLFVLSRNHAFNCLRQIAREQIRKQKAEENIKKWYENENPLKTEDDYFPILDEAVEKLPVQQQTAYI